MLHDEWDYSPWDVEKLERRADWTISWLGAIAVSLVLWLVIYLIIKFGGLL